MSREDNGFVLTCIAENVVGMSNASIHLTVQCKSARRSPVVPAARTPNPDSAVVLSPSLL